MVWFKVDDGFWSHPKVLELSDAAVALWVRAGSYCAGHLTDGAVRPGVLRLLGADRDAATELVLAGLWHLDSDGAWRFHDWTEYQPTREEQDAKREAKQEASAQGNHVRWHLNRGITDPTCPYCDPGSDAEMIAGAIPDGIPRPVPSRPDDFYSPSKSQSRSNRARVSTDPIEVSETTRRMAARKGITSLRVIVDAIHRHTGLRVDAVGAYQVADSLLDRAKTWPANPSRYVTAAIGKSPAEVQQFIHERALEAS